MTEKKLGRRDFVKFAGAGAAGAVTGCSEGNQDLWLSISQTLGIKSPNVVLITVDDMNWDSVGVFGGEVPDVTPNIDRLASQGIRFEHAHVNISVCQPCRGVLATGRYAHRSGIEGFRPSRYKGIPTLMYELQKGGYMTCILSKFVHSSPHSDYQWSLASKRESLGLGRDPTRYYTYTKQFIEQCTGLGRPFYLMANSEDPHRPFYRPNRKRPTYPPSRTYISEEIAVPGFLPDLPKIRKELSWYYNSAKRADDTVGQILRAIDETGTRGNTIVFFLSDNGMSFPFSKANCYPHSTRTPWIVRWPGQVKPGSVDRRHMISTIDFMPTVLDALNLPLPKGMDGRSIVPLLRGEAQSGRDWVFTQFHRTASNRIYPMRCVQNKKRCYIFNPWADGITEYWAEPMRGLTFNAMLEAANEDTAVAARVRTCLFRSIEELYDLERDPHCLSNRVLDSAYRDDLRKMRNSLRTWMKETDDAARGCFELGRTLEACEAYVRSLIWG